MNESYVMNRRWRVYRFQSESLRDSPALGVPAFFLEARKRPACLQRALSGAPGAMAVGCGRKNPHV